MVPNSNVNKTVNISINLNRSSITSPIFSVITNDSFYILNIEYYISNFIFVTFVSFLFTIVKQHLSTSYVSFYPMWIMSIQKHNLTFCPMNRIVNE